MTKTESKTADAGTEPLPAPNADQARVTREPVAVPLSTDTPVEYGEREPVPGDPSTEPVATGAQSHVAGRVGPPTFAQDASNAYASESGVEQVKPGDVLDAATPMAGPIVEFVEPEARETVRIGDPGDKATAEQAAKQPADSGAGRRVK